MKSDRAKRDFIGMALLGQDPPWRRLPSRYLALHTNCPVSSDQTSNEVGYTGYERARVPVGAWEAMDPIGYINSEAINFRDPVTSQEEIVAYMFGDPATKEVVITHVSIGTELSGPGQIIYVAKLDTPIQVRGSKIRIPPGALLVSEG